MTGALRNIVALFVGHRLAGETSVPNPAMRGEDSAPGSRERLSAKASGIGFTLRFIMKDRAALAGMIVLAVFLFFGLVEGVLQVLADVLRHPSYSFLLLPSNPLLLDLTHSLGSPSTLNIASIMGYNYEGQSIFSGILYAAPRDALASIVVVLSAIVVGMFVGIPAGYFGGWADEILMRITDAFLAFPFLVLAIALSVILGSGYAVVLIVLVIVWWPTYARYFRAQAVALKSRGFVEASRLSGIGSLRVMVSHVLPNALDPIIAQATLDFGTVIVAYSTLAFLGIGVSPGTPEWGAMTAEGLPFFPQGWWLSVIPGAVIITIVVAFTLLGDRIQDLVGGRMTY